MNREKMKGKERKYKRKKEREMKREKMKGKERKYKRKKERKKD